MRTEGPETVPIEHEEVITTYQPQQECSSPLAPTKESSPLTELDLQEMLQCRLEKINHDHRQGVYRNSVITG